MIRLINLLILLLLSMSAYSAQWTGILQSDGFPLLSNKKYDSCEQLITAFNKSYQPNGDEPWNGNTWGKLTYSHTEFIASDAYYPARFRCYATNYGGSSVSFVLTADTLGENACKKGVVSTAYFERVPSVTVCLGTEYGNLAGCEANLQHVEVLKTKHLGKYGAYGKFSTTGKQCNYSTDPKSGGGSGYTVPPKNICDNKTMCEVSSPGDCPNGYNSGTFNGKTYCVLKTPSSPSPPTSPPSDNSGDTGSSGSAGGSSGSAGGSSGSAGDGSTGDGGGGQGDGKVKCTDMNNCNWVTNDDFNKTMSGIFSEDGLDKFSNLADFSNDSRIQSSQAHAQNSLNDFANRFTFSNSVCIPDFAVNVLGHVIPIKISEYCGLMALIKIFLHLTVLLISYRMISNTVMKI